MIEALILIGILTGSAITTFTLQKRHAQAQKNDIIETIDTLTHLKKLLILIQQHRGLSTGYLNGQHNLNNTITQTSNNIDKLWREVNRQFPKIVHDQLFEGISSHWARLKTRWQEQSISNNIQQHNRLITNLLYLIENQAESNPSLTRFARSSGMDIIWKELLETIEAIGQTRAIGMGIIGEGKSTAVERIQIQFLLEKANTRLSHLNEVFIDTINTKWCIDYTSQAKANAILLNEFVATTFLDSKPKMVSHEGVSETFFKLASNTITPLDTLFVKATSSLKNHYVH